MDALDIEENMFAAGDAKLHGEMFRILGASVSRVLEIFPHIEAARPRSKSGIQSLCSLHIALDKAKGLLQHCSDCSKLYLAITGDSILVKFEKAKSVLQESLRRVDDIVPESIGCQIMEIVAKLDEAVFVLDESEKQAGDELVSLLQKDRKSETGSNDSEELEIFHRAALKLGITSSRAALNERRALKKLLERARAEEDKPKESILSYLYHLMRKYSKLFRSELGDDLDSQGSAPCSPTILSFKEVSSTDVNCNAFEIQLSKSQSFSLNQNRRKSDSMPIPPEEFRCPISLQLMYDPVIIASGQTYERACIEKWFNDGHSTCPKTQQQLSHLSLTPNYCVKGLITSWCEQNTVPIPDGRPDSLDVNYWRMTRSQRETTDSVSFGSINSCKQAGRKVVPVEESDAAALEETCVVTVKGTVVTEDLKENEDEFFDDCSYQDNGVGNPEKYQSLLALLQEGDNVHKHFRAVQQIRYLLRDNNEARIVMGTKEVVETLIQFLRSALNDGDEKAQEVGAMALFNLAVNNNRNKQMLIDAGLLPLLDEMISNTGTYESATALYLNLSCLVEAKPIIGASKAVHFLVGLLQDNSSASNTCKHDALYTLYNLSSHPPNIPLLLTTGIINNLHILLALSSESEGNPWAEKVFAVLINMATNREGREEIVSTPGLVSTITGILDFGDNAEHERAVSCLLVLCSADERCSQMVLQEGVIPSLVSISVNGSSRGREKAHRLLKLFREQRQRESSPSRQQSQPPHQQQSQQQQQELLQEQQQQQQQQLHQHHNNVNNVHHRGKSDPNTICKSRSKKIGRALTSIWKYKSFAVHHS